MIAPTCLEELTEAVLSAPRLLAVGAGTKPRLSAVDAAKLSTSRLRGIVEYEPSEFTFTALSGTPLSEIAATLAGRGQYLPFDPMLAGAGATLGGTVAAGLNGPGRFRFGGLRDFIIGVRFVDGTGRLLRMGGKVVKNAAGFDLPKFFTGSLGRFGVLGEITFKVFPRPAATLTLRMATASIESASEMLTRAAGARWELDALDILPGGTDVVMRLAGPEAALQTLAGEIQAAFGGRQLSAQEANALWKDVGEFQWAHPDGLLAKAAPAPADVAPLARALDSMADARVHISSGGNVAYISLPAGAPADALDVALRNQALSGVTLRGAAPLWLGRRPRPAVTTAVKQALDPANRFPSLDD